MKKNFDFILVILVIGMIALLQWAFVEYLRPYGELLKSADLQVFYYIIVAFLACLIGWLGSIIIRLLKNKRRSINKTILKKECMSKEFEEIYNKLYRRYICGLENIKNKAKIEKIIQYIATLIFSIGCGYIYSRQKIFTAPVNFLIIVITIISVIIIVYFMWSGNKYSENYKERYKKNIITNFIKLVNEELIYISLDEIDEGIVSEYRTAEFDDKQFNEVLLDDYIKGNINENEIKMVDLVAQLASDTNTEILFQGIFAITEANVKVDSRIKIMSNKIFASKSNHKIQMDSEEFEKYFAVYTEDKIMAMRILTSDMMQLLVGFARKLGIEFEIVLKDKKIYIRFHTGAMFIPSTSNISTQKRELLEYFNILKFVVEVTEKFNNALKDIES